MQDYPKIGDKVVVRLSEDAKLRLSIYDEKITEFDGCVCEVVEVDSYDTKWPIQVEKNGIGCWVQPCDIEPVQPERFQVIETKKYSLIGEKYRADSYGIATVKISANAPDSMAAADRLFVGNAADIDELIALLSKMKELTYGT